MNTLTKIYVDFVDEGKSPADYKPENIVDAIHDISEKRLMVYAAVTKYVSHRKYDSSGCTVVVGVLFFPHVFQTPQPFYIGRYTAFENVTQGVV